jgi:predicted acylesterase/phospholipase RssA
VAEVENSKSADTPESTDPWKDPPLFCDIVMKGGITSGVVYPSAAVRLARRYRFCSIGGTSAGAIAAAAVAAAEYGRASGGFRKLAAVPAELAGKVGQDPFILTLFQPEPGARGLFRAALAFQRHGALRGALATMIAFWRFPLLALGIAWLSVSLGIWGNFGWIVPMALLAGAPWIVVFGVLRDAMSAFGRLASNDFGLCRLGPGQGDQQALTVWLHQLIQGIAGRGHGEGHAPITFADLWGVAPPHRTESAEELAERRDRLDLLSWNAAERAIDLQVMTTNLTVGRPLRLPMTRDRWRDSYEEGGLLFDPEEWSRFFPADVVKHMVENAVAPDSEDAAFLASQAPGKKLLHFPGGAQLPIVVAARMSLSFPVLISTVPLWQVQYRHDGNHQLRRMVFSDGGISSNFPVHLFDAPLPTRPTFALNLAGFENDEDPNLDDPRDCVRDPAQVTGRAVESWKTPESMFEFLVAIKDAMENWRDNAQARMPGFRERVMHIRLAGGEGGLNLAMDDKKVKRLTDRGDYAGGRLIELFSGPEAAAPQRTAHWNDHRFARFRVLMSVMERFLTQLRRGYKAEPDAVSLAYETRIEQGFERPYSLTPERLDQATRTLASYLAVADAVTDTNTLDDEAIPHPKAVVRVAPPT